MTPAETAEDRDARLEKLALERDRAVALLRATPCVIYATGGGAHKPGESPWKVACPWCEAVTTSPSDSDADYEPASIITHKDTCELYKFLESLT